MRSIRSALRDTELATADSTDRIYVKIHYFVVYRNASESTSLDLIKSQHQMLNACYNNLHTNLAKVPTSGRYNFSSVVGNPAIVMLPSDYTKVTEEENVTRVACTQPFESLSEVMSYVQAQGISFKSGYVNMIIAPLDGVLGEAELVGNHFCVTSGSVGGELEKGSISNYDLGVTAVHELGHNLGLPHVFSGDCQQTFSDIPAQVNPNYEFQLFSSGGVWDASHCNRYRDCSYYKDGSSTDLINGSSPPYSCFPCQTLGVNCTDCDTGNYEMGMNFLDYGVDEVLVMFSAQQALYMRQVLISGNAGIDLYDTDGGNVIQTGDDDTTSSSTLSLGVIIGIVVAAIAAIVAIALGIHFGMKHS